MTAEVVTKIPQCRFCRCTEGNPCTLPGGEICILNVVTETCSKLGCAFAALAEKKRLARQTKAEARRVVGSLVEGWRKARERRVPKKKKFTGRTL